MDLVEYIDGLRRENSEALGFIPKSAIAQQYIRNGRYLIQRDLRGRRVGYILHGAIRPCGILKIEQAVIDYDRRLLGFGNDVVSQLLKRAGQANVRCVYLHCADGLESNSFWLASGFVKTKTAHPDNRRQRAIHTYVMDLWPRLF